MGWCTGDNEDAGHEGYIVSLVRPADGAFWRELCYPNDIGEQSIAVVQVGCDCGWRSPRMHAPFGTSFAPFVTILKDEAFEERCRELWHEHVKAERNRNESIVF
jgi:hypothetical protein